MTPQFSVLKYAIKQHIKVKCLLLLAHLEIVLLNLQTRMSTCLYTFIPRARDSTQFGFDLPIWSITAHTNSYLK